MNLHDRERRAYTCEPKVYRDCMIESRFECIKRAGCGTRPAVVNNSRAYKLKRLTNNYKPDNSEHPRNDQKAGTKGLVGISDVGIEGSKEDGRQKKYGTQRELPNGNCV
mmetsp:Transcript_4036/g.10102  ORF Transcript_4036/g.10102 Transcript_4036/m.10102 type:complete len:109 (+) Transcript_4036:504-830(+)